MAAVARLRSHPPQLTACVRGLGTLVLVTLAGCGSTHVVKPWPRPEPLQPKASSIPLASLRGRIVFSRGDDIWIAHADGSHAKRVTTRPGPEFDPSWSPDGSRVAYRDSRHGINRNDEIYTIDANGAHRRNLTRSPTNEWSPSWSPDGKLIAFYSRQLYVMRSDGSGARPITNVEGEYPAWSPDGQQIAFMSSQPNARGADPNYDIFVVNRDGTALRQLTSWPGEDGWPAWSPDGKRIVFTTTHGTVSERYDLWIMLADGSRKHRLTAGSFSVWSPDGRAIMFSTGDEERLAVIRPDGSGLRTWPIRGELPDWHRAAP